MLKKITQKITKILAKLKQIILTYQKTTVAFAAGLSLFAYAPFSFWPLMIFSFFVLAKMLNKQKTFKQQLSLFTTFVFVFNVTNLHWVGNSFLYHAPEPWLVYLMPLAVLFMALLLTAPYMLIFIVISKLFNKLKQGKNILILPIVFVLAELLRSFSVYGFPWNLVGYSIASNDYLLAMVRYGTIILCSFLIIIIASLCAKGGKKNYITAFVILFVWNSHGVIKYYYAKANILDQSVQLIQIDNVKHHGFNRQVMHKQFAKYLSLIKEESDNGYQVMVLPEMAVPYPINTNITLQNLLQKSIKQNQLLITGAPAYDYYDVYNSMYFISKDEIKRYDKKLLVPFGEFMPFRSILFFMKNFTNNFKDFSVGKQSNIVEINNHKFLSLICYEAIFPFFVKKNIQDKQTVILNITNDAWFYGTIAPYQHALITKARSVENNVRLIRVSNAGSSFTEDSYSIK